MARDESHKAHLGTQSYAEHMALNSFYDGIIDLADRFVESAQGKYGLFEISNETTDVPREDPVSLLRGILEGINSRAKRCDESFLEAIIDDINELFYSTIYKLEYLN